MLISYIYIYIYISKNGNVCYIATLSEGCVPNSLSISEGILAKNGMGDVICVRGSDVGVVLAQKEFQFFSKNVWGHQIH